MFWVKGGIYTNVSWTVLQPGTEESYGPFATYEEARIQWASRMWSMIDNCLHRLTISQD